MNVTFFKPAVRITHGGVKLPRRLLHHFVTSGTKGEKILFLHGFTDSWKSFSPLFPYLSPRFRLTALDQRGHGESETPYRFTIADFTTDAISFIETIMKGPVHLVGHSLGAIVAQRVALARPDLVKSILLIGATPTAAEHAGLQRFHEKLEGLKDPLPREFVEEFQRGATFAPIREDLLETLVDESLRVPASIWRETLKGLLEDRKPDNIALPRPTLILWGEHDAIFDETAQKELKDGNPDARTISYSNVGHAPHWEVPSRVANDIAQFIDSQKG